MMFYDFPWFSIILHDFPWVSMIFRDFLWFSMIFYDFPWFSTIFYDFSIISMIFYEFLWFSMSFYDFINDFRFISYPNLIMDMTSPRQSSQGAPPWPRLQKTFREKTLAAKISFRIQWFHTSLSKTNHFQGILEDLNSFWEIPMIWFPYNIHIMIISHYAVSCILSDRTNGTCCK